MSPEPDVSFPLKKYGMPPCPNDDCGYRCLCCCRCQCQTPCPTPDTDEGYEGDCDCEQNCHGGHEPWDCANALARYRWAQEKAARMKNPEPDLRTLLTTALEATSGSEVVDMLSNAGMIAAYEKMTGESYDA